LPSLVELKRKLWGINPGEKVLVVVGPHHREPKVMKRFLVKFYDLAQDLNVFGSEGECYRQIANKLVLKTVGWGECLAITKFIPALLSMGISAFDIKYMLCETPANRFNPESYKDYHIIFLGSIKSNLI
jgi:hypothetical protein